MHVQSDAGRYTLANVGERVDIAATGLLDGLDGTARAERAELIDWLLGRGMSVEQIRGTAVPALAAARQIIGDDGEYVSARQMSTQAGMDVDLLQRIERAMGLSTVDDPDAPVHLRADAEAAAFAQQFIDMGYGPDQIVEITRVLSDGLSHAAEVMRYAALSTIVEAGTTELDVATRAEALVREAAPLLGPMIENMLMVQLRHQLETEAVTETERAGGVVVPGARLVSVAFADLVGFTMLGEMLPPEDLERLANRLGAMARDVAVGPVRFIKTIGDAVMLVSADPEALLDAVLDLVAASDADDFPRLRVGVATGLAVSRAGDWFGSPVNTASRITGVARPGSVLASEAVHDAVGDTDRFVWSFAGARHLKGIKGDVKLFRARRV